jgi:phage terminase large subunit-like protein
MGARGPGAGRRLEAQRAVAAAPKRRQPWERSGLTRTERVIAFVESLPITKGKLAGKKLCLLPGQRAFIEEIYGAERVTMAIKSEPRGNGKTGLLAPLALCHLLGPEAEPRGEVYSAAIDRQQAGIMFNEMEAIILAVPDFASRVNLVRFFKKIEVLDGKGKGSVYEALSSDARRAHGLAPSMWVYDELAQAKDRVLLDNLVTAMGKRERTLGIIISTQAASDDHALSQLIDDGLGADDPSVVVHLMAAPEDADPFTLETLQGCNPALGIFLDQGDLMKEANRAKRIPAFEPAYRNLRLNQRIDSSTENRLATAAVWRLGATPVDLERLRGRRCYGGLDLSGKHDLTALVLVFPDDEPEPSYDIVPFFWTPEGAMENRAQAERERFQQWIAGKHLTAIPGPVIRFRTVAERLAGLRKTYGFDVQAVGYDRWRIDELKLEIEDIGGEGEVDLEEFGQGWKDMAPAIEFFTECALTGRLHHAGHPVLSACVANAILVPDAAGNMKIDKGKSNSRGTTRVDGAVALVMALGTARRHVPEPAKDYQLMFVG